MCQCKGNSCCSSSNGCSCGSSCGCSKSQCGCKKSDCSKGEGCNYAAKFLELADQAWMDVLKEKIKENIRQNSPHLDELAKVISEANHERWKHKMEEKSCCGGYEEKLKKFFNGSSCCNKK